MRCRPTLTRVDALRTGELPDEEHRAVEEHLRICKSCEESAADVDELAQAVKALVIAPPRPIRESLRTTDFYDQVENVWVAFSDRTIRMISGRSLEDLRSWYGKRYGRALERAPIPDALRKQVVAAVHGEGVEKPAIDLRDASELERRVMQTMARIPRGEVRSYSWLAEQVGKPRAVRAVANVVARNCVPFILPCHRVVPAGGGVGKYAYGSKMKRDLLRREGVARVTVLAGYLGDRLQPALEPEAKALGLEWYDLWGIAPPNRPDHPWAAITAFKEKFGGVALDLVPTLDLVYDEDAYRDHIDCMTE